MEPSQQLDATSATADDGPRLRWTGAEFDKFLERLTDEHVELDMHRMRDVLHVFERTQQLHEQQQRHQQQLDKHQHDKLQHQLERQLLNQPSAAAHQHQVTTPPAAALVVSGPMSDARPIADNFTNRTGDEAERNGTSSAEIESNLVVASGGISSQKTEHHQHHHVVGEHVAGGRLVKGPHGALVVEPDEPPVGLVVVQHERLDVNPIELKANHAGTMLSYGHGPAAIALSSAAAAPSISKPVVVVSAPAAASMPAAEFTRADAA